MAVSTAPSQFLLARQTPTQRLFVIAAALLLLLAGVVVVSLALGTAQIPYERIPNILLHPLGLPLAPDTPGNQVVIVHQVRLPRILLAMLVGGALAASGTVMQGIFRNPLADPGLLGVSAGGSAGAVIAFASGFALRGLWATPLVAFIGALLAALVVTLLSLERGRANMTMLLLAGTALNAFLGAVISAILLLSTEEVSQAQLILNWLVGGLAGRGWRQFYVVAPVVIAGVGAMLVFSRDLNLLLLGEETAQGLGTNVARVRLVLLGLVALVTGVCVSVTGPIGFVGLIVPHLLRFVVGPDHRVLLPTATLAGGVFLVGTDTVARMLIGLQEVPVGVVTGLLGGPFFLLLLWRYRRNARLL
jgi:iron complex transport system permease protein